MSSSLNASRQHLHEMLPLLFSNHRMLDCHNFTLCSVVMLVSFLFPPFFLGILVPSILLSELYGTVLPCLTFFDITFVSEPSAKCSVSIDVFWLMKLELLQFKQCLYRLPTDLNISLERWYSRLSFISKCYLVQPLMHVFQPNCDLVSSKKNSAIYRFLGYFKSTRACPPRISR